MLLITTCRKPCTNTRVFARTLSNLVPCSEYAPRGKGNIYSLIEKARQKGLRRIAIVSEMKGNPSEIAFIKLDKRNWDWAESFKIKSVKFEKQKDRITDVNVEGKLKAAITDLFDINESQEPELTIEADSKEITFGDKMNIKLESYKKSEE
jgi:rRNA maturation protein Rpf1